MEEGRGYFPRPFFFGSGLGQPPGGGGFSRLKRQLYGTHHAVSKKHLIRRIASNLCHRLQLRYCASKLLWVKYLLLTIRRSWYLSRRREALGALEARG